MPLKAILSHLARVERALHLCAGSWRARNILHHSKVQDVYAGIAGKGLRVCTTTGVILCKLTEAYYGQLDLFGETLRMQRLSNLYESVDTLREKYGKHTVFLGASFLAHTHAQHDGERGHLPERQHQLLPGETTRKRLGIPMLLGEVH